MDDVLEASDSKMLRMRRNCETVSCRPTGFQLFPMRLSGIGRWWRWDSRGGAGVACFTLRWSARTRSEFRNNR